MASSATKSSAPTYTPPAGTVNVGTAIAPVLQNIPSGKPGATNNGLAVGQSRTDSNGGVTTNVTGQAPQVLSAGGTPTPGAPKLDLNGNIIPGTGSATTANSGTATAITNPQPTTPPVAPLTPPTNPTQAGNATGNTASGAAASSDAATAAKYKTAHAGLTAGGSTAPVNPGDGSAVAANAAKNSAIAQPVDNSNVQNALQQDPAYQQLLQDQAEFKNATTQSQTLEQHYKDLQNEYNIPALNTQLMNMKNVIDGTENDIRSEVTAAHGFATNSQILALSDARNKTVIQNYNNLQQTLTNAQNQVTTMIGLSKEDQANALSEISQKLNIDQQLATYADKFKSNAKEGYNNIISAVGYSGLYNGLINSDPTGKTLSNVAQLMGVTPAQLKVAATSDAKSRSLDTQVKEAQIASSRASTAKSYSDIAANNLTGSASNILSPYLQTSYGGQQYADLSSLTPKDKAKYAQIAANAGVKPILDSGTASKLNAISVSKTNLQNINDSLTSQHLVGSGNTPFLGGLSNSTKSLFGNADVKSFNAWRTAVINNVQALAGGAGSGLRINQAEIDSALKNDLPTITGLGADNLQSAQEKIAKLNSQMDVWNKQLLGGGNQASQPTVVPTNQVPAGYYQASDGKFYKS